MPSNSKKSSRKPNRLALRAKPAHASVEKSTSPKVDRGAAERVPALTVGALTSIHLAIAAAAACVLVAMVFGQTIVQLWETWSSEQDYSHGFVVAPFAALILWIRSDTFPRQSSVPGWGGLALIALGMGLLYLGDRLFLNPLAGWALVVWLCGACWVLLGRKAFVWALPGLAFLLFMVPLPFRFEQLLSWRMQLISTDVSTWMLQFLGQPAVSEGNVIYLGDSTLEVERACSGIRMFMGISAVAYVFAVLARRSWWEKVVILCAVPPIAIVANSFRITLTGLFIQYIPHVLTPVQADEWSGYITLPFAALLFGMLLLYLRALFTEVELETGRVILKQLRHTPKTLVDEAGS